MSNEEAIKWLNVERQLIVEVPQDNSKELKEAYDMAIKALEQEPCDDCISRQEVLDYIEGSGAELGHDSENELVRQDIKALPSVTPQTKIGKWVAQDIHNCHADFKCSACGYIHSFTHLYGEPTADYSYCPNCGAKMEEES